MTQPARVIYLPPGVAPIQAATPATSGLPFDRAFFEQILPPAVAAFCQQTNCSSPIVEVMTVDGTTHYINGISGVTDTWVALHTSSMEHEEPVQVFIPYQTIFRVEIHPAENERRHRLGFLSESHGHLLPPTEEPPPAPEARARK